MLRVRGGDGEREERDGRNGRLSHWHSRVTATLGGRCAEQQKAFPSWQLFYTHTHSLASSSLFRRLSDLARHERVDHRERARRLVARHHVARIIDAEKVRLAAFWRVPAASPATVQLVTGAEANSP